MTRGYSIFEEDIVGEGKFEICVIISLINMLRIKSLFHVAHRTCLVFVDGIQ